MSDDAATPAPASPAKKDIFAVKRNDEGLPQTMEVVKALIEDVTAHFVDYLKAGALLIPLILGMVVLLMVLIYTPMIYGMVQQDETIMFGGMAVGMLVGMALLLCVLYPVYASSMRAVDAHLRGVEPLSWKAPFSTATQDLGSVLGLAFLMTFTTMLSALACYVPALVVLLLFHWAMPMVFLHRMGPVEALSTSFRHAKEHFTWTLGFWGMGLVAMMATSSIPILGYALMVLYFAYYAIGYRAVFGTGETLVYPERPTDAATSSL